MAAADQVRDLPHIRQRAIIPFAAFPLNHSLSARERLSFLSSNPRWWKSISFCLAAFGAPLETVSPAHLPNKTFFCFPSFFFASAAQRAILFNGDQSTSAEGASKPGIPPGSQFKKKTKKKRKYHHRKALSDSNVRTDMTTLFSLSFSNRPFILTGMSPEGL